MSIADSDAVRDNDRVLPQHQAAATLLQARLATPGSGTVRWLDLACGRGQLVHTLEEALAIANRGRLEYVGLDADQTFAREAVKTAERIGFGSAVMRVGSLNDLRIVVPDTEHFDFITLTNAVHEISPPHIASVLVTAIERLPPEGALFVYDLETLSPNELGAVPWTRDEMQRVIRACLGGFGVEDYEPEVQRFPHRTTAGWSIHLERRHMRLEQDQLSVAAEGVIASVQDLIHQLLQEKLDACRKGLVSLTDLAPRRGRKRLRRRLSCTISGDSRERLRRTTRESLHLSLIR